MNQWTRTVWSGTREETTGLSLACRGGWMRGKIASRKEFCASGLCLFDSRRLHQFLSQQYRVVVHGPCSAPASKTRSLSGEVVRPRPAPWSAPGPRLFKLWSGRAIRGGSGRGAEGLPGLSARDAGDERRHSNSRMGFGEAQVPDAANRGLFQPDQGGRLYEGDGTGHS